MSHLPDPTCPCRHALEANITVRCYEPNEPPEPHGEPSLGGADWARSVLVDQPPRPLRPTRAPSFGRKLQERQRWA